MDDDGRKQKMVAKATIFFFSFFARLPFSEESMSCLLESGLDRRQTAKFK